MPSLGRILVSHLVANLFMHSLPGMILLYLAAPFLHHRYLNQVCTSLRPVPAWFVKILSVWTPVYVWVCIVFVCVCVCVCVCLPPRLLITSDVIWTPYDWLNKFYSCYMTIIVSIINRHDLHWNTSWKLTQ